MFECHISKGCHSWRDIQSVSSQSIVYKYIDIYIGFIIPFRAAREYILLICIIYLSCYMTPSRGGREGGLQLTFQRHFQRQKQLTLGKGRAPFRRGWSLGHVARSAWGLKLNPYPVPGPALIFMRTFENGSSDPFAFPRLSIAKWSSALTKDLGATLTGSVAATEARGCVLVV